MWCHLDFDCDYSALSPSFAVWHHIESLNESSPEPYLSVYVSAQSRSTHILEVVVKVVDSLHSWCRLLAFLVCSLSDCVYASPSRGRVVSAGPPQHQAKWSQLPWHQMSATSLGPSKSSCHVRWWGNTSRFKQFYICHCLMLLNQVRLYMLVRLLMICLAFIATPLVLFFT